MKMDHREKRAVAGIIAAAVILVAALYFLCGLSARAEGWGRGAWGRGRSRAQQVAAVLPTPRTFPFWSYPDAIPGYEPVAMPANYSSGSGKLALSGEGAGAIREFDIEIGYNRVLINTFDSIWVSIREYDAGETVSRYGGRPLVTPLMNHSDSVRVSDLGLMPEQPDTGRAYEVYQTLYVTYKDSVQTGNLRNKSVQIQTFIPFRRGFAIYVRNALAETVAITIHAYADHGPVMDLGAMNYFHIDRIKVDTLYASDLRNTLLNLWRSTGYGSGYIWGTSFSGVMASTGQEVRSYYFLDRPLQWTTLDSLKGKEPADADTLYCDLSKFRWDYPYPYQYNRSNDLFLTNAVSDSHSLGGVQADGGGNPARYWPSLNKLYYTGAKAEHHVGDTLFGLFDADYRTHSWHHAVVHPTSHTGPFSQTLWGRAKLTGKVSTVIRHGWLDLLPTPLKFLRSAEVWAATGAIGPAIGPCEFVIYSWTQKSRSDWYLGACYYGAGECAMVTEDSCDALAGQWSWDGECPEGAWGQCCYGDYDTLCAVLTEAQCGLLGGSWTVGDSCDVPCDTLGACCFENGSCAEMTRAACEEMAGIEFHAAVSCGTSPCPAVGRCCLNEGGCIITTQALCSQYYEGFSWEEDSLDCEHGACDWGRCCSGTYGEVCTDTTRMGCAALEGDFVASTTCIADPCTPMGRCCFPDGSCEVTVEEVCLAGEGNTWEAGADCDENPCDLGRCCSGTFNEVCTDTTRAGCATLQGSFLGESTCISDPCEPLGRCCQPDGECDILSETACGYADGISWEKDSSCAGGPCDLGRSCYWVDPDTLCVDTTRAGAAKIGGSFWLDHTCDKDPCSDAGRCCWHAGDSCKIMTRPMCMDSGGTWEKDSICDGSPCKLGACCFDDYTCQVTTETGCNTAQGIFWLTGQTCDDNPCASGRCCWHAGDSCRVMGEAECLDSVGTWEKDSTCAGSPCTLGRCCYGLTDLCSLSTHHACNDLDGAWITGLNCSGDPCNRIDSVYDSAGDILWHKETTGTTWAGARCWNSNSLTGIDSVGTGCEADSNTAQPIISTNATEGSSGSRHSSIYVLPFDLSTIYPVGSPVPDSVIFRWRWSVTDKTGWAVGDSLLLLDFPSAGSLTVPKRADWATQFSTDWDTLATIPFRGPSTDSLPGWNVTAGGRYTRTPLAVASIIPHIGGTLYLAIVVKDYSTGVSDAVTSKTFKARMRAQECHVDSLKARLIFKY